MKILHLITKSEMGGAQVYVYKLAKYFKENGDDVAIVSSPGAWLQEVAKKDNITFFPNDFSLNSFNPISIIKSFLFIKKILKKYQPDIVHCHSTFAGVTGRLVIRGKISTVFTAHGWVFDAGKSKFKKFFGVLIEKFFAKYTNKIICVSEFVRMSAVAHKIAPVEKLQTIYIGVEDYNVGLRSSHDQNIEITFIGRLSQQKDPMILLKAVEKLVNSRKIFVNIIGDGPDMTCLKNYVQSNKLVGVKFWGFLSQNETITILKKSDIFVLTSHWEGLPISILEAMSCGLPIIATDVGGVNEMVKDDNGILVKENDLENLIVALDKLIQNTDLRLKMGENSYQKIKKDFNIDLMFRRINNLYLNLSK